MQARLLLIEGKIAKKAEAFPFVYKFKIQGFFNSCNKETKFLSISWILFLPSQYMPFFCKYMQWPVRVTFNKSELNNFLKWTISDSWIYLIQRTISALHSLLSTD